MSGLVEQARADDDAAQRIVDAVSLHLTADRWGAVDHVMLVRLEDGSSDPALYDSWDDACRHATDPRRWAPLRITPDGITHRDARIWLNLMRRLPGLQVNPIAPEHVVAPRIFLPGGRKRR